MSTPGVFAISRGIFDHPVFADEAFAEREAWIWMIGEAAWKPRRVRVGSSVLDLERGQLAVSTRFAAARWKWSEARVRRFLKRLSAEAMVETKTDAHATLITICNYAEYQKVGLPPDAPATHWRRTGDALATQERRKTEKGKKENIVSDETISLAATLAGPDDTFEPWWTAYPRKEGRKKAREAYERILKAGRVTAADLLAGAERYAAERSREDPKFTKLATTWLNGEHWADEPKPSNSAVRGRSSLDDAADGVRAFLQSQRRKPENDPRL